MARLQKCSKRQYSARKRTYKVMSISDLGDFIRTEGGGIMMVGAAVEPDGGGDPSSSQK